MKARVKAFAVVAALTIVIAVPGSATSGITLNSFSTTDSDAGDPVGVTLDMTTTVPFDWLVIDLGGAIDFVDSDPNSPQSGDVVGSMEIDARLPGLLCLRSTYKFDIEWVSPIGASAPSGTTAQFSIQAPTGDLPAYLVPDSGGNDILHVDMRNLSVCSSDPRVEMVLTFFGHVETFGGGTGAVVATNGPAGTYTITVGADGHSDTTSYTVY